MKILLISNMYPSASDVAYGVFVKNFETDMLKRGFSISKAVIRGKGKNILDKYKKYFKFYIDIYSCVFKKEIKLIYVHYVSHSLLPLFIISVFIKKPLVVNVHGSDLLSKKLLSRMILSINYYTIKNASMIVVPSEYFKNIVIEKYKHKHVFVSPSGGIDLSLFFQNNKSHYNTKRLLLGYVSRIEEGKGWDVFLKSLVILREINPTLNIKAVMVGGGSQEQKLKNDIVE